VHALSERVIVTGDVLQSLEPLFMEADLTGWPAALTRLEGLDFDVVIPGHGSVQHGRETVCRFGAYIVELRDRIQTGIRSGKSLKQLQAELTAASLDSLGDCYGIQIQRERKMLLGSNAGALEDAVRENVAQVYRRISSN
jgi:glyoxylase-like metal-dependent hydrolase (beta-lactamase superfamily II)